MKSSWETRGAACVAVGASIEFMHRSKEIKIVWIDPFCCSCEEKSLKPFAFLSCTVSLCQFMSKVPVFIFLRDSRSSSNICLYNVCSERVRDQAWGYGEKDKIHTVSIWSLRTLHCLWKPQPYQASQFWLLWQRMTTKATLPTTIIIQIWDLGFKTSAFGAEMWKERETQVLLIGGPADRKLLCF